MMERKNVNVHLYGIFGNLWGLWDKKLIRGSFRTIWANIHRVSTIASPREQSGGQKLAKSARSFAFLPAFLFLIILSTISSCINANSESDSQISQSATPQITLELNPGEDNPRNSEGDFVTLQDGRIMFVYSKYVGDSSSDHAPASLAARYSSDGGLTWTSEDEIIVPNEGGMNVMS